MSRDLQTGGMRAGPENVRQKQQRRQIRASAAGTTFGVGVDVPCAAWKIGAGATCPGGSTELSVAAGMKI